MTGLREIDSARIGLHPSRDNRCQLIAPSSNRGDSCNSFSSISEAFRKFELASGNRFWSIKTVPSSRK